MTSKLEKIKKKVIKEEVETFRKLNLKLNVNEEEFFDELYGKVIERTIKLTAKQLIKDIEKIDVSQDFWWLELARKDFEKLKKEWGVEE